MSLMYVTGGARSGKSSFAEKLAEQIGGDQVTYLATAQAFDDEMAERIGRHRQDRPPGWRTVEEPLAVPEMLSGLHGVVLLDCLSLWVSNLLLSELDDGDILGRVDSLLSAADSKTLIVVSNEIGSGIVPDNALARRYRDLLGWANQRVAAASDEAYLTVSGLSLRLK
jgi:adenosylcobinamide kinase / adenosylcobinamide-phosphate guanylyltransferase